MAGIAHNPHDKLFKDTFARKESLLGFMRAYLPNDITSLISEASIEPYTGTFVDEQLKEYYSDIVYKFLLNDKPAFLYLLFEHQSTPAPMMALRLLRYLVKLWGDIEKKEHRPDGLLPPVLPLVLYHGSPNWNVSRQFQDLIKPPSSLIHLTPGFEYLLVDLNQPENQDRVDDLRCRFVLHLMHAAASGRLLEAFQRQGAVLAKLCNALAEDDSIRFLETVCRYAMSVDDAIDLDSLKRVIEDSVNKEAGDIIMSLAEKLEAKGRAEGEAQGRAELLQTQLRLKFPDAPAVDLEGLTLEQLDTVARRILTCDTREEVLEGIQEIT